MHYNLVTLIRHQCSNHCIRKQVGMDAADRQWHSEQSTETDLNETELNIIFPGKFLVGAFF